MLACVVRGKWYALGRNNSWLFLINSSEKKWGEEWAEKITIFFSLGVSVASKTLFSVNSLKGFFTAIKPSEKIKLMLMTYLIAAIFTSVVVTRTWAPFTCYFLIIINKLLPFGFSCYFRSCHLPSYNKAQQRLHVSWLFCLPCISHFILGMNLLLYLDIEASRLPWRQMDGSDSLNYFPRIFASNFSIQKWQLHLECLKA